MPGYLRKCSAVEAGLAETMSDRSLRLHAYHSVHFEPREGDMHSEDGGFCYPQA